MEKVMISACLVGEKTRYDGKGNYNPLVREILQKYDLIPLCPEVLGGLKTPRLPSEIVSKDKVLNKNGDDVTRYFINGAHTCLQPIYYQHVTKAILTENSPSCGVHFVHNGKFNDELVKGEGFTTKLLKEKGIEVYTIEEFYDKFIKKNED